MTELKPCPFCGGEAELNLLLGNYCVTCKSCMGAIFPAAGRQRKKPSNYGTEGQVRRNERNKHYDYAGRTT